jgi:hypothetical protein
MSIDTLSKKEISALLNAIVAVCAKYQCNFLHVYQVTNQVKIPAFALKKAEVGNESSLFPMFELTFKMIFSKQSLVGNLEPIGEDSP